MDQVGMFFQLRVRICSLHITWLFQAHYVTIS